MYNATIEWQISHKPKQTKTVGLSLLKIYQYCHISTFTEFFRTKSAV